MKLINFNEFLPFKKIREKMNIPKDYKSNPIIREVVRAGIKLEKLKTEGIDISIDEVIAAKDKTLWHWDFPGQKIIVYIRDYNGGRMYGREDHLPKFHISWCKTLKEMTEKRRHNRYVISQRIDGKFLLNKFVGGSILVRNEELELKVCKYCLQELNYKNYNNLIKNKQNEIYENFNIKEFFAQYDSKIHIEPLHTSDSQPLNEYEKNWKEISYNYRKSKKFICQDCGKDCSGDTEELHVHHINGLKYENNPSNLEVVCVKCHSQKPMHEHMKSDPKFNKYL